MILITRISGPFAAASALLSSFLSVAALTACGDSGGAATATATTTTTGPATTTDTGPGTTTGLTTEAATTTTGVTGTTGTTTTGTTTTGVTTTTTGVTTTTGATGTTTTTTDTGETTDPGTTTGEPVAATCEEDSDCQVYTDCCSCDVQAKGEVPPACGIMECLVDVCSTLDIGDQPPVCRFGRCTFAKISCHPLGVQCDAAPPNCPLGQVPSVDGTCWTGQCAPVEACDWVPDCDACAADKEDPLVCVLKGQKGAYHVCEPKPVACGEAPEIDCGCGAEICDASPPHELCVDMTPGIVCDCPNC